MVPRHHIIIIIIRLISAFVSQQNNLKETSHILFYWFYETTFYASGIIFFKSIQLRTGIVGFLLFCTNQIIFMYLQYIEAWQSEQSQGSKQSPLLMKTGDPNNNPYSPFLN